MTTPLPSPREAVSDESAASRRSPAARGGERPDYWLMLGAGVVMPMYVPAVMIPNYDDEPRKRVHQHVWINALEQSRSHSPVEVCFKCPI